jgi:hypothetical protein
MPRSLIASFVFLDPPYFHIGNGVILGCLALSCVYSFALVGRVF